MDRAVVRVPQAHSYGQRYLHFTRREAGSDSEHAYVQLLQFGQLENDATAGFLRNESYRVVDLRYAAPSLYLRPHAQHGLLAMRLKAERASHTDFKVAVTATLRVPLERGLRWLGRGELLETRHLFPPPTCDEGYRHLLENLPPPPSELGSILHIGA